MSAAIALRGVCKSFSIPLDRSSTLKYRVTHPRSTSRHFPLHVLRDVTLDVQHGEFVGIVGHNGSGKSTLLKTLARIYTPDSGTVEIDGAVSPFLELGVGFNPELNARENIYLNGAVLGLGRGEIGRRMEAILAFAGAEVQQQAQSKLKNFSSGMQVRLAFAVAIQADADILLMDEVLAVGDSSFQEKCLDTFMRYKREGRTIVLVTHDMNAVLNYCDRALLLDHGRIVDQGRPADVVTRYRGIMAGETAGAAESPDEFRRFGSREVEITGLRLVDGAGAQRKVFETDMPFTVEIDYLVNDEGFGPFNVGIGIERGDGLGLAGPNTAGSGQTVNCPPVGSVGTVRYVVDRLALLDGNYFLTVSLHDRHFSTASDTLERALKFRVVDTRYRSGLIDPQGVWDIGDAVAPPQMEPGKAVPSLP